MCDTESKQEGVCQAGGWGEEHGESVIDGHTVLQDEKVLETEWVVVAQQRERTYRQSASHLKIVEVANVTCILPQF